jgi:hypothetical protein
MAVALYKGLLNGRYASVWAGEFIRVVSLGWRSWRRRGQGATCCENNPLNAEVKGRGWFWALPNEHGGREYHIRCALL